MKKLLFSAAFAVIASALFVVGCKKDDLSGTGSVEIEISNLAGDAPLDFGTYYKNENGDSVRFSQFNYFLSNFVLIKKDGSEHVMPKDSCYFLVKHDNTASKTLQLNNVPAGDYKGVRFMIGIDSSKSVSEIGQRTGVLDPTGAAAGMYWSWNSGYIFVKIEGTSPQAPLNTGTGERTLEYHTGLFGGKDSPTLNNLKTVALESDHDVAEIRKDLDEAPIFHVLVDVLEMFKSPTVVKVADTPTSHAGPFSKTVADNYADMITLDHIHNH